MADGGGFRDSLDTNQGKTCEFKLGKHGEIYVQLLEEDMSIMNVMSRNKNAAASYLMLQDNLYQNTAVLYPYTVIKVIFFPRQHCHTFSPESFSFMHSDFYWCLPWYQCGYSRIKASEIKEQGPYLCFCEVFKAYERHHLDVIDWFSHHSLVGDALPLFLHPRTLWPMRLFNQG